MKSFISKLSVLVILLMPVLASKAQFKEKETAIRQIFTVLQQKDEQGFVKLFPDAATTIKFIQKLLMTDPDDNDVKGMKEFMKEINDSSLAEEYRRDFKEVIEEGEGNGVEWNKARLVSFTADSIADEATKMSKLSGKIYFNSSEKEYFLKYDEVLWFENSGWYGVSIERIDEKIRENEPDMPDWQGADSTVMMDSVMVMIDSLARVDTTIIEEKEPMKKKSPAKKTTEKKPVSQKKEVPAKKED